jgi:hypothetical protein
MLAPQLLQLQDDSFWQWAVLVVIPAAKPWLHFLG